MRFKIHSSFSNTGGPDCLHQLCGEISKRGYYAAMVYPPIAYGLGVNELYSKYNIKIAETREENADDPDTVQVIPANWGPDLYPISPELCSCIKANGQEPYKSKKIMWWLGLTTWQYWEMGGIDVEVDLDHPSLKLMYHACQSQMVYDFIINSGKIDQDKVFMLRDYTNKIFIHSESFLEQTIENRKNIILYNPAKGTEITNIIIEFCKDLPCEFVPLFNMNHEDMKNLGLESKIYIDFGHFPGRDKIPRELA